jgi:hypothetical protein
MKKFKKNQKVRIRDGCWVGKIGKVKAESATMVEVYHPKIGTLRLAKLEVEAVC